MSLVVGSVGRDGGYVGWDVHRGGSAGWVGTRCSWPSFGVPNVIPAENMEPEI